MSCGAACSRWARERAAGGPAQESAGQGSRKRARGRRRLAGLRSASAIAGFSPFEMEEMNAYLHPSEHLLPFSSYNEQDRRRVRAGADTLRHSTTGAAGGRRRAHTHTHTHCRTHTTQHHTRGNLVLLIFIPTHPPWSWAQPESRFSERNDGWTSPYSITSCTYNTYTSQIQRDQAESRAGIVHARMPRIVQSSKNFSFSQYTPL